MVTKKKNDYKVIVQLWSKRTVLGRNHSWFAYFAKQRARRRKIQVTSNVRWICKSCLTLWEMCQRRRPVESQCLGLEFVLVREILLIPFLSASCGCICGSYAHVQYVCTSVLKIWSTNVWRNYAGEIFQNDHFFDSISN